jgi:rubredoxin
MSKRNSGIEDFTSYEEHIICPSCESQQTATVRLRPNEPFWDYVHTCTECGYIITESEWEYDDPFRLFGEWCKSNGFADALEGKPEDVNLERLDEAIAVYAAEEDKVPYAP